MNRSMATIYEQKLRNCKLQQESTKAVDMHFNYFMKLVSNLRSCDYTISDDKLVHMYFSNLPSETQRSLGVTSLRKCKTVSAIYALVKEMATVMSKPIQRTHDRDIVNVNTMHANNNRRRQYYGHGHNNSQNNYTHFNSYNHQASDDSNESADDDDSDHTSIDTNVPDNENSFDISEYNYSYPTEEQLYDNETHDDEIDEIYFNAVNIKKDHYTQDWKCFHCGDTGHRAGWFCNLVRQKKPQTPRGAAAYAEYQRKYAKDPQAYDIVKILMTGKKYWEQKGIDIHDLVKQKSSSTSSSSNSSSSSNTNNKSKPFNRFNSKKGFNSSNSTSNSIKARILANQKAVKQSKNVTSIDSDSEKDNDVQVISNNNSIHDNIDENIDLIEVSDYAIHCNTIVDTFSDTDLRDLYIIHQLVSTEKMYAHPLLVQVELNGILQNVLLDQGSTRNICRESVLKKYYPDIYHEILSSKCAVISSSNTMIPIKSRVKITVKISDDEYQDVVFYVVSDTPTKDIVCSFILGRTFLSTSGLCYDNELDILFNKNKPDKTYMKVLNGRITSELGERPDIKPLSDTNNKKIRNINLNNILVEVN